MTQITQTPNASVQAVLATFQDRANSIQWECCVKPQEATSSPSGTSIAPAQSMDNTPLEPRDERTFAIIGAAMEVHRVLGSGFLDAFYRDALAIEFGLRSVPFTSDVPCKIEYKGNQLRGHYRMDFVCFDSVVVEVKARSGTGAAEQAQVLNYLAATGHPIGLLLNFGARRLEYKRFILTKPRWPGPRTGI